MEKTEESARPEAALFHDFAQRAGADLPAAGVPFRLSLDIGEVFCNNEKIQDPLRGDQAVNDLRKAVLEEDV